MHPFEAEAPPHGTDLGHEAIDALERWVIRSVGLATAKLVVKDDWTIYCQGFERLQVVVTCARSPVEQEERNSAAGGYHLVPHASSWNGNVAFTSVHHPAPSMRVEVG